jgi:tryptophan 2,3-dioxygenase
MTPQAPVKTTEEQLTYGAYLRVADLIKLQKPQSNLSGKPHHDELLFIIIHQTYELWFKQLLHELDAVCAHLKSAAAVATSQAEHHPPAPAELNDAVYEAARLLRRCTEIMRVLVEQFTILETMLPTHFLAFRGKLRPASGFQSEQFRELEFLCGLKDEKLLRYHEPTDEAYAALERRLHEPSLRDVFFEALQALQVLPSLPAEADAETQFKARAEAIRAIYRDERGKRNWIDVCERLTEFDELLVSWRLRHIQMVERTIGVRLGTGGSSGASYLKVTLDKKFFPELWEARTMLTE